MPRCEMCGAETDDATRVKVEGAELRVCDDCTDHGTTLASDDDETETTTKYSTGGEKRDDSGTESTDASHSPDHSDPFDEADSLVPDYGERIRAAREERGLSQADLADALGEKQSHIRKLEQGDVLPDEDVQQRIERHLDIDLSGDSADGEWEGGDDGELTLGDVVRRD